MDLIDRLREYASTRKGKLAELITEAADALERQTCEDAVSRQQAIDAINSHFGFNIEEEYGSAVQEVINGLPSAQPDGIPLEWIDKHLEWLDNCDNDFAQLAKVSIRAMVEIWKKDKT